MTEAKGAAASTTSNPGEINAPECNFATHKEKNTGGNGSRITVIDSSNTSNREIRGDIMHAQRAKMGIKTDRDGGARRQADGYGNSRGDGKTVISINNTNRGGNPNMRTYTRAGK